MSSFNDVAVTKKANIYFDGKVSSRTLTFSDGSTKTLGFMLPGEYHFNTQKPEIMEIQAGRCAVKLNGSETWNEFSAGTSFEIPGDSSFDIRVEEATDYICSFV